VFVCVYVCVCVCVLTERANVASSPSWLWLVNIKDKTTEFDLNLTTQFIVMFMSMGVMLSQSSFFSFSLSACLPVGLLSQCGFISSTSLLSSTVHCLFLSSDSLSTSFPSPPVLPISIWTFSKKLQLFGFFYLGTHIMYADYFKPV